MKPRKLLRPKAMWAKFGCGKTKFDDDYRFHSADDPFVPGTNIPRLKPIPLGERNIAYLEHEGDALIDALAELRDAVPVGTRTTQHFLTDALSPRLEGERRELLERRARLRAQVVGDPDPETKIRNRGGGAGAAGARSTPEMKIAESFPGSAKGERLARPTQ